MLVAWRLPAFPQYVPGQEDRQRAEEQFAALRDEARRFRSNWSAERLSRLDAVANSFVECIDDDLEKENVLKELPKQKENIEAINGVEYVWTTALVRSAPGGAGICIYIRSPLHRGLSLDEVRDFLTLSQTQEFSSDDFVPRRGMRRLPADGQLSSKLPQKDSTTSLGGPPVAGAKSDSRRRVEGGMPYLTMAYVRTHDSAGFHNATAVKVSNFAFITAAHVLLDRNTRQPIPSSEITVTPHFRVSQFGTPNTNPITISRSIVHPSYTLYNEDDPRSWEHDLGFIFINSPVEGPYTAPTFINSLIDGGVNTGGFKCPIGAEGYDPLYFPNASQPPKSLYNGDAPYLGSAPCLPPLATTETGGYPEVVGGQLNDDHYPYRDVGAKIRGSLTGGIIYELYRWHSCSSCKKVVGVISQISTGNSGGPVFGFHAGQWSLLGIIGSKQGTPFDGAVAAGNFDYNSSWISQQIAWVPGPLDPPAVIITEPIGYISYDANLVPNLQATAGTWTPEIQWTSSIDGYLGSGGNVPVAGQLSPGEHVITATLPPSSMEVETEGRTVLVSTDTIISSITITVTGVGLPKITADPEQVVVPFGKPSANTNISWTVAGGTSGTNVAYSLNGAPIIVWKNNQAAGSDDFAIRPGDSVIFYSYRPGSAHTSGKQVTVTGRAGAQPSLVASPNPIPIPSTMTSGSFDLTWLAEGYEQVTLYGRQNIDYPGQIRCLGSSGNSGTAPQPVSAGEVGTLWLYPYTECTPGAIVSSLPKGALASLELSTVEAAPATLVASPNPVIIPSGLTTGSFMLSWTAEGYDRVTAYGRQNIDHPGQIICLGSAEATGNAQQPAVVGEVVTIWLLPDTGCTPGSVVAALPVPEIATTTVHVNAAVEPTMTVSQNPVVIPMGQVTTHFTLSWGAPGYSQVTLYGRQNLEYPGQIRCLGSGGTSGSAQQPMTIGEEQTLWLLPYTGCAPGSVVASLPGTALSSVFMTAVAAAPTTMSASPNPTVVPAGVTSSYYLLSWDAPGFSQVTLYGRQNLQFPGQIRCLGSGPGSGSAQQPIAAGEIGDLWLLPYTGCTPGTVVNSLPIGVLATQHVQGIR